MFKPTLVAIAMTSLTFAPTSHAAGELAVDEPLNANARQNVRPVDELVVDRAYDLFADPRTRVGDLSAVVPADGAATNAKVRAASRPATNATTRNVAK